MTGGTVLRLGAIAVTGTICALTIRRQTPELALILVLVTAGILLSRSRFLLEQMISLFWELTELSGLEPELTQPLIRTVGIALVVRLGSQVCRDGGAASAAVFLELCGSGAALVTAIPLIRGVMELIGGLL